MTSLLLGLAMLLGAPALGLELGNTASASVPRKGCQPPFVSVGFSCIYATDTESTWNNMRTVCQDLGGDLAIYQTANEFADVLNYLVENGLQDRSYWVGGTDIADEGTWEWLDGTPMKMRTPFWSYTLTYPDQRPDGWTDRNCAVMINGLYLYLGDTNCEFDHFAICEM